MIFPNNYKPLKPGSNSASETSFLVNTVAFLMGLSFLILMRCFGFYNLTVLFVSMASVVLISTVLFEALLFGKRAPICQIRIRRKFQFSRFFYKIIGLTFCFLCIGAIYSVLPLFRNGMFVTYFVFLGLFGPIIILLGVLYFAFMDCCSEIEKDEYYRLGYWLFHFKGGLKKDEAANLARSWLVKLFYLSLMQPAMIEKINWFMHYSFSSLTFRNPKEIFWTLNAACFFIDLTYASFGYMLSFKVCNTQVRTAEPTLLGWMSAVMCYWPFWGVLFYSNFFDYHHAQRWMSVFETGGIIWWIWCAAIIILELLYALATVSAGIRFSNLTYRGLWNTGPYKWTKHPAYVFKNVSWWLIAMPFMLTPTTKAIQCCILLFGVNMIYYTRAKTEERHLSHYPEYRAYALEMNEKSIFKPLVKVFPFLKYKEPKA